MKQLLQQIAYEYLLIAERDIPFYEKWENYLKLIASWAPIAFFLDGFDLWFANNKYFLKTMIVVIMCNMLFGAWRYLKINDFHWDVLMKRTLYMFVICFSFYLVLEMIRNNAGENVATEAFKYVIQVTVLMYPGAKFFKSIYVLTNGELPPEWLMKRVYGFQETGNLTEFISSKESSEKEPEEEILEDEHKIESDE